MWGCADCVGGAPPQKNYRNIPPYLPLCEIELLSNKETPIYAGL